MPLKALNFELCYFKSLRSRTAWLREPDLQYSRHLWWLLTFLESVLCLFRLSVVVCCSCSCSCVDVVVFVQKLGCQYTRQRQEEPNATALCMLEGPAGGDWVPSELRSTGLWMWCIIENCFTLGCSVRSFQRCAYSVEGIHHILCLSPVFSSCYMFFCTSSNLQTCQPKFCTKLEFWVVLWNDALFLFLLYNICVIL